MILVHLSVWIDYFRGTSTGQTDRLDDLLGAEPLAVGDLMLAEILQGFTRQRDFDRALKLFDALTTVAIVDRHSAILAARHFRILRALGITVRKTIDTLIAARCIADGHSLLFSDRDFDPFVRHLGLVSAMHDG